MPRKSKIILPGLLAAVTLLGSAPVHAAPAEPTLPTTLSLDEALQIFRTHGLDLLIAEAAVQSAEGDVKVAGAIPNPNWNVGLDRSFFQSGTFETPYGWSIGVGDSNALEDTLSGKRGLRQKVAETALRSARLSRVDAQRTLEFQLKSQYMQAVLAQDTLDFSLEVQGGWGKSLQLSQLRYQKGAISEVDEANIETAKLESDQAVSLARQALQVAKAGVAFLLGVRSKLPHFDVAQDLPKFQVPAPLASATEDSLLSEAILHRPDLRGQAFQNERANAAIALARRLRFPDIALSIQYTQIGSFSGTCPSGQSRDGQNRCFDSVADPKDMNPGGPITGVQPPTLFFGLNGTLPLFYQQQGEIKKAHADLSTQAALYAKIRAQIVSELGIAHTNYSATRELVERMEGRLLERARLVRDLTKLQYEKGAASLIDYLIAQRTFIAVNVEYLGDLANYWTAIFQLEQAVGMELRQ